MLSVGDTPADPYFEEIPAEELHFYQRKGARRKRRLPDFIPAKDLKILDSVKRKAYRLDLQLSMCGFRIGWAGIIGLIPWVGDVIGLLFALQILHLAQTVEGGLPASVNLRMMSNIMFDFGIGLIPIVGDFINIMYKCNSRNFILLEEHLVKKHLRGFNDTKRNEPAPVIKPVKPVKPAKPANEPANKTGPTLPPR